MDYTVRPRNDPLRNFKFQVVIQHPLIAPTAQMGFTNVAGMNMTTEAIPYREGGWNTNTHKLPGQTDFGPLTLIQGMQVGRTGMWDLAKNMFSRQWGGGGLDGTTQFRFTTIIRVLDHPVTKGKAAGGPTDPPDGAKLAFVFYDCWVGSVAFNDLDAAANAVLISQMTLNHEGFEVLWDTEAVAA